MFAKRGLDSPWYLLRAVSQTLRLEAIAHLSCLELLSRLYDISTGYHHPELQQLLGAEPANIACGVTHDLIWRQWVNLSLERVRSEVLQHIVSSNMCLESISRRWSVDPPIAFWAPPHSMPEERALAASNISIVAVLLERDISLQNMKASAAQVLRLIHERFTDPQLSLVNVSDVVGISERQISRLLKRYTGQSFTAYMRSLRVEKGKRLLLHSDKDVADIAARVGYGCSRWFTTYFLNSTGLTPRQFRERTKSDISGPNVRFRLVPMSESA
jgi:AraC-like DNA-binding protein